MLSRFIAWKAVPVPQEQAAAERKSRFSGESVQDKKNNEENNLEEKPNKKDGSKDLRYNEVGYNRVTVQCKNDKCKNEFTSIKLGKR